MRTYAQELLDRAKRALGKQTTRATVEAALLSATEAVEAERKARIERQLQYFRNLPKWADLEVMRSDEMWR